MIIAHLSDLHLGHRAFGHVEQGRNVREADVARAFHHAIQRLLEIAPSAVLVSGDVFDRPEPPHSALVALAQGLQSLREKLPDTPVLMVAGARDTPPGRTRVPSGRSIPSPASRPSPRRRDPSITLGWI